MERASYTKEQLDAYYKRKIDTMTSRCMIDNAEAKGKAEGLEKGEAIGLEKGRKEVREKMVLNSHQAGIPIETIATITALTTKQIEEILKSADSN